MISTRQRRQLIVPRRLIVDSIGDLNEKDLKDLCGTFDNRRCGCRHGRQNRGTVIPDAVWCIRADCRNVENRVAAEFYGWRLRADLIWKAVKKLGFGDQNG